MMNKRERMAELVRILNEASKAYYTQDTELMSNFEYDALYDELMALEAETGVVLTGSPSEKVGYEAVSELPKEEHEFPMLSLDKTKDIMALTDWLGDQKAVLSWKMDGLTIALTYEEGRLVKAVTRGNGRVGEVVTANVRAFQNVPARIPFQGRLVLRGEAIISYSDFERINASLAESEVKYKNPRNLCSGSVRQLDSSVTASRKVSLYAFALVFASDEESVGNSAAGRFEWLKAQGFDVVEYRRVKAADLADAVADFQNRIQSNDFPSDGLVLLLDDIAYGRSLGTTAKFPRNAIAFKWADELQETKLLQVEWSASRTGLINPVAIFEPVELEGTTVSRASLHNVSIVRSLKLGIGDTLQVYKANMIIPQIARNLSETDTLAIPGRCPVCGGETVIRELNGSAALFCENPDCQAKHIGSFTHFVSRDAFAVEGLSEATLEKLIQKGCLHRFADIFQLQEHKDTITSMEGMGEKSFANLMAAIEKARDVSLPALIYSLGIPGIGLSNAALLCRHFNGDLTGLLAAGEEELTAITGVGSVMARSFLSYFADTRNRENFDALLTQVRIRPWESEDPSQSGEKSKVSGMTIVITGSLNHFASRKQLKEKIENLGGKVAGSVSSKTDLLINNDASSNSSKNQTARKLGIPVITEEDFLERYGISF